MSDDCDFEVDGVDSFEADACDDASEGDGEADVESVDVEEASADDEEATEDEEVLEARLEHSGRHVFCPQTHIVAGNPHHRDSHTPTLPGSYSPTPAATQQPDYRHALNNDTTKQVERK